MEIKRKLGILEVKQAFFSDERFRDLFPELKDNIEKALKDPTCVCNQRLYQDFFKYKDRLEKYFPNRIIESLNERITQLAKNNWRVINCRCDQLEDHLRKLYPTGRKQLAVCRYENDCTAVLNELEQIW